VLAALNFCFPNEFEAWDERFIWKSRYRLLCSLCCWYNYSSFCTVLHCLHHGGMEKPTVLVSTQIYWYKIIWIRLQ